MQQIVGKDGGPASDMKETLEDEKADADDGQGSNQVSSNTNDQESEPKSWKYIHELIQAMQNEVSRRTKDFE